MSEPVRVGAGRLPEKYHRSAEFPLRLRILRWLGRQQWLPKGQDRLLRLLCGPGAVAYPFEIDFFGQKYRGDLAQYIDWLVFCYGSASLPELDLLRDLAAHLRTRRRGPLRFVDVGANVGHHALFMARVADEVVAFEPFPPLLPWIEDKIAINHLTNVRVIPAGLGAHDATQNYFPGQAVNPAEGSFLSHESRGRPISLAIRNGDNALDEIGFGRLDLLKVDVQGYEPFVFRGLSNRILQDRPVIVTELSDESRSYFGGESSFRESFYENATIVAVTGRSGRSYRLRPFVYGQSQEVLVAPPELADFVTARLRGA